jgi:hypothetical protein
VRRRPAQGLPQQIAGRPLAKDFEAHGEGAIRIVGPLTRQRISRLLCSVLPKAICFRERVARSKRRSIILIPQFPIANDGQLA